MPCQAASLRKTHERWARRESKVSTGPGKTRPDLLLLNRAAVARQRASYHANAHAVAAAATSALAASINRAPARSPAHPPARSPARSPAPSFAAAANKASAPATRSPPHQCDQLTPQHRDHLPAHEHDAATLVPDAPSLVLPDNTELTCLIEAVAHQRAALRQLRSIRGGGPAQLRAMVLHDPRHLQPSQSHSNSHSHAHPVILTLTFTRYCVTSRRERRRQAALCTLLWSRRAAWRQWCANPNPNHSPNHTPNQNPQS